MRTARFVLGGVILAALIVISPCVVCVSSHSAHARQPEMQHGLAEARETPNPKRDNAPHKKNRSRLKEKIVEGFQAAHKSLASIYLYFWVSIEFSEIRAIELKMQSPEVYEEVARILALYCQTVEPGTNTRKTGTAWLPKVVRDLDPGNAYFSGDDALITMGGGFYHFGYRLEADKANSNDTSTKWDLFFRGEETTKFLCSLMLSKQERVSANQIIEQGIAAYDDVIATDPQSIRRYQQKLYFLLQFKQPDMARNCCDDIIEALPDHWWPRLTAALMDAGKVGASAAVRPFKNWVQATPKFSHYMYLSYFYQVEDQVHEACAAIASALRDPLAGSDTNITSHWFLAYSAAVYSFHEGRYSLVVEICDKVNEALPLNNYGYFDFQMIRAAALFLTNDDIRAIKCLNELEGAKPTNLPVGRDLQKEFSLLKGAIHERNEPIVRDWAPDCFVRFDPFGGFPLELIRAGTDVRSERTENSP